MQQWNMYDNKYDSQDYMAFNNIQWVVHNNSLTQGVTTLVKITKMLFTAILHIIAHKLCYDKSVTTFLLNMTQMLLITVIPV